jgi:hypothetical protein
MTRSKSSGAPALVVSAREPRARFSGGSRIPDHELETFDASNIRQAPAPNSELESIEMAYCADRGSNGYFSPFALLSRR